MGFWKEVYYVKDYKKANLQDIDAVLNAGKGFDDWSSIDSEGKITVSSDVTFWLTDNLYTKIKFKQNGSDSSPVIFYRESDGSFTIRENTTFYAGEISFGTDNFYYQKNSKSNIYYKELVDLDNSKKRSITENYFYNFFKVSPEFRAQEKNIVAIQRTFKEEEEKSDDGFYTQEMYNYSIQKKDFTSNKLKFLGMQEFPFVCAYSTKEVEENLVGIYPTKRKIRGSNCDLLSYSNNIYIIKRKVDFSLFSGLVDKANILEKENSLYLSTNFTAGGRNIPISIVRWVFSQNRTCKIIADCSYEVYKLKNNINKERIGVIDKKAEFVKVLDLIEYEIINFEDCFEPVSSEEGDSILNSVFIKEDSYELPLIKWENWDVTPSFSVNKEGEKNKGFVAYNYNPTTVGGELSGSKYPAGSLNNNKTLQVSCEIKNYRYLPGNKITWKRNGEFHQHDTRYGWNGEVSFQIKYCYLTYSNHLLDISTTDLNFFPNGISLIYDEEKGGNYSNTISNNDYREYYTWCRNWDSKDVSQISYNYHNISVKDNIHYISLAGVNCTFNKNTTNVGEGSKTTYAWYVVIE